MQKIFVTSEDMELLRALHRRSEKDGVEYTMMGGAVKHEGGFLITKLVAPTQEVSPGYVQLAGAPTWMKEIQGMFPVWIHTHLCQAFWSSTDENTIQELTPPRLDERLKVTVSVVLGRDKFRGRLDVHSPLEITVDDIPVELVHNPDTIKLADNKVDKMLYGKVSRKTWNLHDTTQYKGYFYDPNKFEEEDKWNSYKTKRGFLV